MKKTHKNKLLVVVDGSDRSIQTAQYLSDMTSLRNHEITLFHVFNKVPESYYDLAKEPASVKPYPSVHAWEAQQHDQIKKHVNRCRQLLLAADFNPNRVQTTIHNRQSGIARDIIAEARKGYDALVLRRRGLGRLRGLVIGSVAFKLLDRADFVPLIFAGRKPFTHRILIAVDGSDNAMRAVMFAGEKLKGSDCRIRLLSVLRGAVDGHKDTTHRMKNHELFDDAERSISAFMEKARKHLIAEGFRSDAITEQIIKNVPSRAAAIVQAANDGDHSTIVMGRKGGSLVSEFTIGRVSTKVILGGNEFGVWLVP
jgi:nucleotide-binding universal stress UspA family protein